MADRIVHGFALSVRDVPRRGLEVQVIPPPCAAAHLQPQEAAELADALRALADDAVHESRARRRRTPSS